jgi:tripartite-type tricarboxylate transporter receptor subunit TctC
MKRHVIVTLLTSGLLITLGGAAAQPQQWSPTRPIRMLLAYPPGAANDSNARAVAGKMTENIKQQVIVDNRPGANGIVATTVLARSAPDGHTLMAIDVAHAANPALYDKIPYDTLKDFEAISLVARLPMILLVHPAQPFKSVKDLVAYAKANAGKLNYGAAGVGSAMYLVAELFKEAAGIDLVQIAYKGGAPALIELAGGQLPMAFISLSAGMPMVQSGRARVLGVSSAQRVAGFPDLPTIAESGVPGFEFYLWQGIIGPAGMPRATLTRLNSEIISVLSNAEVKERLTQAGNELIGGTPQQAAEFIRTDVQRWRKIINPEMRLSR